ncbi:hypothetical protein NDU88_003967 [Pleurodeles waltl]|uniref:Uncharacterized protein n=1 Tax=Pleurodeles waltl TaxID=8319 RepID=A0AAV7VHT7_PLEWA|nr:hypothetical protein NDU88_003967 [Pleurodeles waltl]
MQSPVLPVHLASDGEVEFTLFSPFEPRGSGLLPSLFMTMTTVSVFSGPAKHQTVLALWAPSSLEGCQARQDEYTNRKRECGEACRAFTTSTWLGVEKSPRRATREEVRGKRVCASISPQHTRTCVVIFHAGKSGVVFRRVDSLFLWIAGITRCPGSVRGFSCLFSGCASICGAARRIYELTAGVASISPLDFDLRGCALKLRSHGRRRVDFSSRGRAALSLRGRASDLRSSQERRVDQRRCAAFFSPRNKLCVEIFSARSVQVKERSLFGPETSGNRRQALSKPLESTFTARQEFSKATGQQQGSSPL